MVRSKPCTGNDTVHMYMVIDFLIPGMKNLNDTGCCTEMLFISGKFQKRFGTASVEKSVQEFLVTVNEGIQFVGKCEYHMEIRGINHFCSALVNPEFLINGLTVGAVPVAAGIVVYLHMFAITASAYVVTKLT